jgi:hypothetical protein
VCDESSRKGLEPVKYVFHLITEMLDLFEIGVGHEREENDPPFSRKALNELEIDWFGRSERGRGQDGRGRRDPDRDGPTMVNGSPSQLFQAEDVGVGM